MFGKTACKQDKLLRVCSVNYANIFPVMMTFVMTKVRLPAVGNCQGYLRVRLCSPFLCITLCPLCVHPPLSPLIFLCFISLSLHFSTSTFLLLLLLSLSPPLPEETVDSRFTVMQGGRALKRNCVTACVTTDSSQLCPQCPSLCVTLMWR